MVSNATGNPEFDLNMFLILPKSTDTFLAILTWSEEATSTSSTFTNLSSWLKKKPSTSVLKAEPLTEYWHLVCFFYGYIT